MTATTTSRDAYHALDTGEQCSRILAHVERSGPCTRRMTARALGMETSTVSARVNELVKHGDLCERFIAPCPITGVRVNWIDLPDGQMEMAA